MNIKKNINRQNIIALLPLAALAVLFLIFCTMVNAKGYRLDMYLKIVFNEALVLAIVATGATFIYTLGTFDISLGASTLFSATLGVMVYNKTENIALMMAVILLTGIVCSLLNSVLASIFHIPAFVTTVAMMSVLSAVSSQIITVNGGALGGINIPSSVVKPFDNMPFKIAVLSRQVHDTGFCDGRYRYRARSIPYSCIYPFGHYDNGFKYRNEYLYSHSIWWNAHIGRRKIQDIRRTGWRFLIYAAERHSGDSDRFQCSIRNNTGDQRSFLPDSGLYHRNELQNRTITKIKNF